MKNTNTSNNAKTNSFEEFNANNEYLEYQKAMKSLQEAQDKFLNKQREFMKRWHEENAKRYNAEMAKVMQKYNTSNQFYPSSAVPPYLSTPFSAAMPPHMSMHPSMMCQSRETFYHDDIENEKLFRIVDTIMNDPIQKRDGVMGLAMLAEKVAKIADPAACLKVNGVGPDKAYVSIMRRGPFGERVVRRTISIEK